MVMVLITAAVVSLLQIAMERNLQKSFQVINIYLTVIMTL